MASAIRSMRIFSPRSPRCRQASGVALGFDRLVMLASGALRVDQVVWTPPAGEGMNRIDPKLAATLRQPAELIARGLAPAAALADLERVAARYAIAVTPDIAAPDRPRTIPTIRSRGNSFRARWNW